MKQRLLAIPKELLIASLVIFGILLLAAQSVSWLSVRQMFLCTMNSPIQNNCSSDFLRAAYASRTGLLTLLASAVASMGIAITIVLLKKQSEQGKKKSD